MAKTNPLNEKLAEIDARIEELNNNIALAKALEELHENENFEKVILEGYLEKEAERLFGVLVEPSTLKRDVMENIQDKLTAIRNIKQYFGTVMQNAAMAPDQIAEEQAFRKEVTEYFATKDAEQTEE